ncbi:hypothetical protein ACFLXU_06745 [Chloroflexota bacterium]
MKNISLCIVASCLFMAILLMLSCTGKTDFNVKSLDTVPSEVTTGQISTATVLVENIGTIEGT